MSTLFRIIFILFLGVVMGSCTSNTMSMPQPSSTLVVQEGPFTLPAQAPDLVIKDMFYVRVEDTSKTEFPSARYDLHIIVKNAGTKEAKNFLVEVISDEKVLEFDHVLIDPANDAHWAGLSIASLSPGVEKEVVWKQVAKEIPGFGANFFIGIVDRPRGSAQLGDILEGPTIAAEKNNTMGIPAPPDK